MNASSNAYNICLICGSHTDLVLNIFVPRCGPNIVDIIFAKFKFKAEKNSADKFICYDCNNWLINWFSLQNINETSEKLSSRDSIESSSGIKNPTDNINCPQSNNLNKQTLISQEVPDFNYDNKEVNINQIALIRELPAHKTQHRKIVKLARKRLNERSNLIELMSKKNIHKEEDEEVPQVKNIQSSQNCIDDVHQHTLINDNENPHLVPSKSHIFDEQILSMLRKQGTVLITEKRNDKFLVKEHHSCLKNTNIDSDEGSFQSNKILNSDSHSGLSKYDYADKENVLKQISNNIPQSKSISLSDEKNFFTESKNDLISIIID